MSRVKKKLGRRGIQRLVWLVLTVFVLLGFSLQSAVGSAYYFMVMQTDATIGSPPVILEQGTTGTSTIYLNNTSAKASVAAARDWWSMDYGYRRRIKITNNNATVSIPAEYTINLTIDTQQMVTNGKLQADGDDLRIVWWDSSSSSWLELDRLNTTGFNTMSTTIEFMTQASIAGGSSDDDYYVYYGNPSVGSPPAYWSDSMGADTSSRIYVAADDFQEHDDEESPDGWDPVDGYFKVGASGSDRFMNSTADGQYVFAGDSSWTDYVVKLKMQDAGSASVNHLGIAVRVTNVSNLVYFGWRNATCLSLWKRIGGSYTLLGDWVIPDVGTAWHTHEIRVKDQNLAVYHDGTYYGSASLGAGELMNGKVGVFSSYGTYGHWDDYVVREYISPEASTAFGSEERNELDYVDNNLSDIGSPIDAGTHSNFTAQQYGPDSIYDTLTEANTSMSVKSWGTTTPTGTYSYANYRYMGGISPNIDNMTVTRLHVRYSGTGTVAVALYTGGALIDPTAATKRTEAYNVAVSSGWNEIDVPDYNWESGTVTWIGLCHGGGSIYSSSSSADAGDFQSARGRWSQTTPADANETNPMPMSPGDGTFGNYWYAMYVEYEAPNYQLDLEVQWTNVDFDETNEEMAIYVDMRNTHSLDASGGYMIIGDGTPDWGSMTGTISFWVKMDGSVQGRFWGQNGDMETRWSGTNLVLDWGATASITSDTSFSADTWYFVAIVWNENINNLLLYVGDEYNPPTLDANSLNGTWTSTTPAPIENRFMNGLGGNQPVDGHGDDLRYWNATRSMAEIQGDYDVELTGSETNLRSYFKLANNFDDIGPDNNDGSGFGSYSFSSDVAFDAPTESLLVDVWNGSTWQNVVANLANGWNNISVSSYLTNSNFTVRFKGGNETGDTAQDSWYIDATLLHVWTYVETTYDYVLRVNNTVTDSWEIRLKQHSDFNVSRLQNCTICFRNSTDVTSSQIVIENGAFVNETGTWYDLGSLETIYIAMTVEADSTGTSYIYTYLEIRTPGISTYAQYVLTFKIE